MKLKLEKDVRDIVNELSNEQRRMLLMELIERWPHPRTCACIKVSEPFEDSDGVKKNIIGPGMDDDGNPLDCDCGADEMLAKRVDWVLTVYKNQ